MTPSGDSGSAILSGVKRVILVLSGGFCITFKTSINNESDCEGKGGVGKSTVTAQLALAHQMMGLRVGVLDVDLCGHSIPRMLGLQGQEVHHHRDGHRGGGDGTGAGGRQGHQDGRADPH